MIALYLLEIEVVGAARFELATPCAQGRFRQSSKTAYFQLLSFQADVSTLLKFVDGFGFWRLAPATKSSTTKPFPERKALQFSMMFPSSSQENALPKEYCHGSPDCMMIIEWSPNTRNSLLRFPVDDAFEFVLPFRFQAGVALCWGNVKAK